MKLPRLSTPPALRLFALKAYLRRIASDNKPILAGPFRSEVGFECLYWIPFLKWALKAFTIDASRFVIVSRGGAAAWYPGDLPPTGVRTGLPAARLGQVVDLYTLRSLDEVRLENQKDRLTCGIQKQLRCTAWDRMVLDSAVEHLLGERGGGYMGLHLGPGKGARGQYHVLHPSWMYWAFEPFWEEYRGLRHVAPMLDFSPIPSPQVPMEGLPAEYVAVRFYHRATFPDQPPIREFVAKVIGRIASQIPVVLLNQPTLHVDDHHDIPIAGPNVIQCPEFPPDRNLELMSAVIGRSQAFVGTYGGVAQLALRMGKPSLSFYAQFHSTAQAHLSLSRTVSAHTGVPFVALSLQEAGLCKLALRDVVAVQPEAPKEPVAVPVAVPVANSTRCAPRWAKTPHITSSTSPGCTAVPVVKKRKRA